ncbi:MAG: DNRLRE domain-containing protein [Melioribacteraceae bacterium]|nr:DNRLRE domain-containing protein [Melioribacteraceae bacterium]
MKLIFITSFILISNFTINAQTDTRGASHDSYVSDGLPNYNLGSETFLLVSYYTASEFTLIKFPLDSYTQINSAVLRLYVNGKSADDPYRLQVFKIISDWDESTVTWSNRPGFDINDQILKSFSGFGWIEFNVTRFVNDWLEYGDNYGFLLRATAGTKLISLESKEGRNQYAPSLVIEYNLPSTKGDLQTTIFNVNNSTSPIPGANAIAMLYNSNDEMIDAVGTNNDGVAYWEDVEEGSNYYYKVFHEPQNPSTLFGLEYWGKRENITIVAGELMYDSLKRNMPYINEIKIYNNSTNQVISNGESIVAGTELRITSSIINPNFNGSENQTVKSRVVIDRDTSESYDYDFDETSRGKSILKNNSANFSLYYTPTEEGTYYYVGGTSSNISGIYKNTDGWAWDDVFNFNVTPRKQVEILSFDVPTGEMQRDQNVNVKVKIKNTSLNRRSFWVGLSFAEDWVDLEETPGPWPDGWYDIRPKESKLLNPEESTIVEFDFNIPSTLPSGTYRARTAIWNDYNSSLHKMLEPRFKKLDKTSFRLGNYPNPMSPLATQLLDITSKILFDDTPFENMSSRYYENDNGYREKVLLYIKISANAQLLGLPVKVGGAILIDLADLFDITNEGKDEGWVSVWIDGEAGVSVSANSFEIDMGLAYHKFNYGEIALADYRKKIIAEATAQTGFIVFSGLGWNEGLQYPRIKIVSNFDIGIEATATLQELYSVEINKQYFLNALMQADGGNLSELGNSIISYLINNEDNEFIRDKTEDDGNYWVENKEGDWSFDLNCSKSGYSNYFYTSIVNEASELKVIADNGIGDADLYIKYGSRPKLNDYDSISSNLNTNSESIVIENPDIGDWYFMLYAKSAYSGVNLSVRSQNENHPPDKPQLISPEDGFTLTSEGTITFSWSCTDPDGDELNYKIYICDENQNNCEIINTGTDTSIITGEITDRSNGTFSWYAEASDGQYQTNSEVRSFTIDISDYTPTWVTVLPDTTIFVGDKLTFTYVAKGSNPLTFTLATPNPQTLSIVSQDDTSATIEWTPVVTDTAVYILRMFVTDNQAWDTTTAIVRVKVSAVNINGVVSYNNSGELLDAVTVTLSTVGELDRTFVTNANGAYSFTDVSAGEYSISAAKTTQWGGALASDALETQLYVVNPDGGFLATPLQKIAADVVGVGNITSSDALAILNRSVGINDFQIDDWQFETASITVGTQNKTQNLKGICAGDARSDYSPALGLANNRNTIISDEVLSIEKESEFELPILISQSVEVGSYTFKIKFNLEKIEFIEAIKNSGMLACNQKDSIISVAWINAEPVNNLEDTLLVLKFRAKNQFEKSEEISFSMLDGSEITDKNCELIADDILIPRIIIANPVNVKELNSNISTPTEFYLYLNYPNPFNPTTTIKYDLPETGKVTLSVFNSLGQKVETLVNSKQAAGTYEVNFNTSNLSSGIYLYRITVQGSKNFVMTKKMILLR